MGRPRLVRSLCSLALVGISCAVFVVASGADPSAAADPEPQYTAGRLAVNRLDGLFTVEPSGANLKLLDPDGFDAQFSPDGRLLAWYHYAYGDCPRLQWRRMYATTNPGPTGCVPDDETQGMWWSPANAGLAYTGKIGASTTLIVAANTGDWLDQETASTFFGGFASWAPVGTRIVFREADGTLRSKDGHYGAPVQIDNCVGENGGRWSPDGKWFAYVRTCPGASVELWVWSSETATKTQLVSGSSVGLMSWSPKGASSQRLLYNQVGYAGGPMELWTSDASGAGKVKLDTTAAGATIPDHSWDDAGARISYSVQQGTYPSATTFVRLVKPDGTQKSDVETVYGLPAWGGLTPDGSKLVYGANNLLRTSGPTGQQLTTIGVLPPGHWAVPAATIPDSVRVVWVDFTPETQISQWYLSRVDGGYHRWISDAAPDAVVGAAEDWSEFVSFRWQDPAAVVVYDRDGLGAHPVLDDGAVTSWQPLKVPDPQPKTRFVPVAPVRVLDTRLSGGPLGPNSSTAVPSIATPPELAGKVRAVVLNVTATDVTAPTFVTAYPYGQLWPGSSNLNVGPGDMAANLVTVAVGEDLPVALYNAAGSLDLVADVAGYYVEDAAAAGYRPVTPQRLLDTRTSSGAVNGGSFIDVAVAGAGTPVPADAVAVVLNVTGTETSADTYVTVWPAGEQMPPTSSLNLKVGETRPNLVTAKVGAEGNVSMFNAAGSVQLVADVVGYYTETDPGAKDFVATVPFRLFDTRWANQPVDEGGTISVDGAGVGALPAGARALVVNTTVTEPQWPSFLTVFPSDVQRPLASNLNFGVGQTIPNLVVTGLSPDGHFTAYNEVGSTQVIFDVAGYFADHT